MGETPLEEQLRRGLARDAERVRTSPNAWTRIQQRETGTRHRFRRFAVAAAGITALAVVVAVSVLARPAPITIDPDPAGRTPGPSETAAARPSSGPSAERVPTPALAWSSVPLDGPPTASLEGIASVGDTVLVVGEAGRGGATTWLSRDAGETFSLQPARPADGWMAAAAVDGRILVVGSAEGRPAIDVFDPASGTWEIAYRGEGAGRLYGVTDGPGGPIATGNVEVAGGRHGLIVRLGSGGWSPVDAPAMDGGETVLYHVVGGPRGYVATGYGPDERSIVDLWFSADGREWTHVNAAPAEGIRVADGVIDALVADPEGGTFWAVQAGGDVWASDDGRRWSIAASLTDGDGPMGFRAPAATGFQGGLLVVAGEGGLRAHWMAGTPDGVEELGRVDARSLTVGAGITHAGDAVLVPLSTEDGPFVWRGVLGR